MRRGNVPHLRRASPWYSDAGVGLLAGVLIRLEASSRGKRMMMEHDSAMQATEDADEKDRSGSDLDLVVVEQSFLARRQLFPSRSLSIGRSNECDIVLGDPAAS